MKNAFQIMRLLQASPVNSPRDWEIILLFCQSHHHRIGTFRPEIKPGSLTSSEFLSWYEEGFGAGDIAVLDETPVVVRDSAIGTMELCDGRKVAGQDLTRISQVEADMVETEMSKAGKEYRRDLVNVGDKYVPKVNERVSFYGSQYSGLGVVRSVEGDGAMELYCHYIYGTKEVGCSMHEKGIVNLHDFHFEPMNIIGQRRLNRELERIGKVWYEKLHRIEPLVTMAGKGEPYWYINDKMKLVKDVEKGTPTSNFRYIAGNYFLSQAEGIDMLGKITDILKDHLAR